jgi:hypothetical protein
MSAARHVVERCPSCGVEHDVSHAGACEACHAPLRYWCRRHGRETGWLDAPACPRCAEEAVRSRPRPVPLTEIPEPRVLRGLGPPGDVAKPATAPPVDGRPVTEVRDPPEQFVGAVLLLLLGLAGGGLAGIVAGIVYLSVSGPGSGGEIPLEWAMLGAFAGFLVALAIDAMAFFAPQKPPHE